VGDERGRVLKQVVFEDDFVVDISKFRAIESTVLASLAALGLLKE
jgi:hypothetical protein